MRDPAIEDLLETVTPKRPRIRPFVGNSGIQVTAIARQRTLYSYVEVSKYKYFWAISPFLK
jgi:hypothetical protein